MPQDPNTWCSPIHHNPEGPTDPLNNKLSSPFNVLIIGGSRGIGAGCSVAYAKANASSILITGRTESTLKQQAEQLRSINPSTQVFTSVCDATSTQDVEQLARYTEEVFNGHLDVVVINAGTATRLITSPKTGLRDFPFGLVEHSLAEYHRVMDLNVTASWTACHFFLPLLTRSKSGAQALVLISSAAAHYTDPNIMSALYSLSKFSATRIIEHVAAAHGQDGVVAYAIQPGGVKTDLADVPEGKGWEEKLNDHVELAGSWSVWLTRTKKEWLSGRYLDARWDVEELERREEEIAEGDLLKFRLVM